MQTGGKKHFFYIESETYQHTVESLQTDDMQICEDPLLAVSDKWKFKAHRGICSVYCLDAEDDPCTH